MRRLTSEERQKLLEEIQNSYTIPQSFYLAYIVAHNYPQQAVEYLAARWWHVLVLFLVPMLGLVLFPELVKMSYHRSNKEKYAEQLAKINQL